MKKSILIVMIALSATFANAQWQKTKGIIGGGIFNVSCIAVKGTTIFAGTRGGEGVFLSSDSGSNWIKVNSGLTSLNVKALAVNGTNIFAGTDAGIFLSTNNGSSWNPVNTGLTTLDIGSLAVMGTDIFAGTMGGGVFLSSNNGNNWNVVNTGLTDKTVRALTVNGTNILAGTNDGVFLSANNGSNWNAVKTGMPSSTYVGSFGIIGTNIFAGTDGGAYLSTNNGVSWTAVNSGLKGSSVYSLQVKGTNIFAGNLFGVYLSTDSGSSWKAANTGFPAGTSISSFALIGSNILAGAFDSLVWKRPLSEMVATTGLMELNQYTQVFDIYPNPSNGKFAISNSSHINSVVVHNLLGEIIYSNPDFNNQNTNEIDLSNIDKGVYFVTIYGEDKIVNGKILIE